ncbi:MAG: NAD+ synthase [Candidatus Acetothermia bacterium]
MPTIGDRISLGEQRKESRRIQDFISKYFRSSGMNRAVVGLSGGIDSAVVAVLCKKALGADNLVLLYLPEDDSPPEDERHVRKLEEQVPLSTVKKISIEDKVRPFRPSLPNLDRMALANLKARVRMVLLYGMANSLNGLVVGTGNLSEWLLGYFTKYGDGAADLSPIVHLFKSEVQDLAKLLDVPKSIIDKPPSAGLWPGQTDREDLGASYQKLDKILYLFYVEEISAEGIKSRLDFPPDLVDEVIEMIESTRHKRGFSPRLDRTPDHLV